ncbi:hypothetical protein OF83DRAFT_364660, partial [Amylostereum chailletii]
MLFGIVPTRRLHTIGGQPAKLTPVPSRFSTRLQACIIIMVHIRNEYNAFLSNAYTFHSTIHRLDASNHRRDRLAIPIFRTPFLWRLGNLFAEWSGARPAVRMSMRQGGQRPPSPPCWLRRGRIRARSGGMNERDVERMDGLQEPPVRLARLSRERHPPPHDAVRALHGHLRVAVAPHRDRIVVAAHRHPIRQQLHVHVHVVERLAHPVRHRRLRRARRRDAQRGVEDVGQRGVALDVREDVLEQAGDAGERPVLQHRGVVALLAHGTDGAKVLAHHPDEPRALGTAVGRDVERFGDDEREHAPRRDG